MFTLDTQIRLKAFAWLDEQVGLMGDVLSREQLQKGFLFEGERIPLMSPQGIFKPKYLEYPLTITTAPQGPYDDAFDDNNYLKYKYRGNDISHRDNIGLREVMQHKLPLIYFHGIIPGKYLVVWPVYVIYDDPEKLSFTVAVEEKISLFNHENIICEPDLKKAYLTSNVKVRLHQQDFRERVLVAYRSQCAFCRLKHKELLDAAHIIPDGNPESKPVINNGISLCKLHHAAYDNLLIGISADYQIIVRPDILEEVDGPMLQHGLQGLHNSNIILPAREHDWPDKGFLDYRFQMFKKAV